MTDICTNPAQTLDTLLFFISMAISLIIGEIYIFTIEDLDMGTFFSANLINFMLSLILSIIITCLGLKIFLTSVSVIGGIIILKYVLFKLYKLKEKIVHTKIRKSR